MTIENGQLLKLVSPFEMINVIKLTSNSPRYEIVKVPREILEEVEYNVFKSEITYYLSMFMFFI